MSFMKRNLHVQGPKRARGQNTLDVKGRVRIFVTLVYDDDGQLVEGNITRSMSLNQAKVSDVIEHLKKTLPRKFKIGKGRWAK